MERESSARLRTVRNSLEWKGARMEMSIKWHVWWVSTDLGLSWFLTFSWVVVAMTWSPGNKPILDKLMLHVSMFLEGTVFIFIACFQYKKKYQCLVGVLLVLFPGLIWPRTFIYWKGSKQECEAPWLLPRAATALESYHLLKHVSAPLAKIRFMSQLIHPQMRISRSSAFPQKSWTNI